MIILLRTQHHSYHSYSLQLLHQQVDFGHLKSKGQPGHTCKVSLGRRTAGHIASGPAFRHNFPYPKGEKADELPAREAAKGVEGSPHSKKVSWDQGQALSWTLTGPFPAGSRGIPEALQEALQSAETEALEGRRHRAPWGALRTLLPQLHNQAISSGQKENAPRVTFPNGAFIVLSSAEKAREMEMCANAKPE